MDTTSDDFRIPPPSETPYESPGYEGSEFHAGSITALSILSNTQPGSLSLSSPELYLSEKLKLHNLSTDRTSEEDYEAAYPEEGYSSESSHSTCSESGCESDRSCPFDMEELDLAEQH